MSSVGTPPRRNGPRRRLADAVEDNGSLMFAGTPKRSVGVKPFRGELEGVSPGTVFTATASNEADDEVFASPTKRTRRALLQSEPLANAAVTPSPADAKKQARRNIDQIISATVRRAILPAVDEIDQIDAKDQNVGRNSPVSSTASTSMSSNDLVLSEAAYHTPDEDAKEKITKGRPFAQKTPLLESVKTVYSIVNNRTGSIGGNGCGGAIYGETTAVSLQRMINLMKEHTNFSSASRFIDVGCGLGKPNLHVAQDPGVEFSYGIEMEEVRLMLGLHNLTHVLSEAKAQQDHLVELDPKAVLGYNCMLEVGNINKAKTFDPFTHVYMFDIGFPPSLFHQLADMFNNSKSDYLISYQGPSRIIDSYEFDVELIARDSVSMHGSKEHHTGYIYQRRGLAKANGAMIKKEGKVPCDPLFRKAYSDVQAGLDHLSKVVKDQHTASLRPSRPKRSTRAIKRYTAS